MSFNGRYRTPKPMASGTMLILDRGRRKRHGGGQANAQVSFEATKRATIGYYHRCKYTVHTLAFIYFPISRQLLLVHERFGPEFAWKGRFAALKAELQEFGNDGDRDTAVGTVIAPRGYFSPNYSIYAF